MKSITLKRVAPGLYEGEALGHSWRVSRIEDLGPGTGTRGQWIWEGGEKEGGDEWFPSKKAAAGDLRNYFAGRYYDAEWGWCSWP